MKLLFDQNISFRIVKSLHLDFPNSIHTSSIGLNGKEDRLIREFALKNEYTIVTFDSDYYEMVHLYGHPPKVIWLRTGNMTTKNIAVLLKMKKNEIIKFISENNIACLEIE